MYTHFPYSTTLVHRWDHHEKTSDSRGIMTSISHVAAEHRLRGVWTLRMVRIVDNADEEADEEDFRIE